jgi:hypothetical protein
MEMGTWRLKSAMQNLSNISLLKLFYVQFFSKVRSDYHYYLSETSAVAEYTYNCNA